MKTRGLIAGAFALALGLSASAADWFDAKISTYTEWPIAAEGVAEGGSWSHDDGATLDTTATPKLVVDAEDDAALTFTAEDSKNIKDAVTINSTVTFNAFDTLPTPPADAKAALIAVKNESVYDIYGLVQKGYEQSNTWAKLFEEGLEDIEDVVVSIKLARVSGFTKVTYTVDGTSAKEQNVYTTDVSGDVVVTGAAFSGCGEVAALKATYVLPMGQISVDVATLAENGIEVTSIVDTTDPTKTYTLDEGGNAWIPHGSTVCVTFGILPNFAKVFTSGKTLEITVDKDNVKDIDMSNAPATAPAKAAIGAKYYLTFDAANDAAQPTDTITLLGNVEIPAVNYEVKAEAIDPGDYTITLKAKDSALILNDGGAILNSIALDESLVDYKADYVGGVYKPVPNGTAFTITFVEGVKSIQVVADSEELATLEKSGTIYVNPECNVLSFAVTAADDIEEPVYSAVLNDEPLEPTGNTFELQDGLDTESEIAFTVKEGKLEGVTFTLTATGIEGTPTYKIADDPAVEFTAGGEDIWTATVPPSAVFTVGYTVDSGIDIPVATWTTDLDHNGNVITMGEDDGAATLAITDAKDAPKDDPDAQKAAEDAIIASVDPEDRKAVTAQIAVLKTNCSAKPSEIAGWIEENSFQGADLATAKAIDVSYDFGMNDLFQEEAKAEVTAFAADAEKDNTYVFEVQLMDGDDPRDVNKATEAAVAKIVQASSDVADFTTEAKKLTPTITDAAVSEGKLTFKVGLPTGAEKAFMRIAK